MLPYTGLFRKEMNHNAKQIELPNEIDGKSFLPLIKQKNKDNGVHKFIRHYCGTAIHALRLVEDNIYKAWFKRPVLNTHGHCGEGKLCPCFGGADEVQDFGSDIQIFDLTQDPNEENPLTE